MPDDASIHALQSRAFSALRAWVNSPSVPPPWEGRPVVIYGAGKFGKDVATALHDRGANVLGFLDRRGTGQVVANDVRAFQPGSDEARRWIAEKTVVILGVFNREDSLRDIAAAVKACGFRDVLTPMRIFPHLRKELGWRFWLGSPEDYAGAIDDIERAASLWADTESRRLFFETLLFRLESDLDCVSQPSGRDQQYAEATVPRWQEPLCMVDAGAYDGDSIAHLAGRGYRFDAIYAFEPDMANFQRLRAALGQHQPDAKVCLWPCGVWSSSELQSFVSLGGESGHVTDDVGSQLSVVALDDVLLRQPVNLIKLDIEGAESEALAGAASIIANQRPGLAVCLYHYPQHLWAIPIWVNQLGLGYRSYLRTHEHNTFDTVLYAIPN